MPYVFSRVVDGGMYLHARPSSSQRPHAGLLASHLVFLKRHSSHWSELDTGLTSEIFTYSNGNPFPGIVLQIRADSRW
jgi:hypothetical protein